MGGEEGKATVKLRVGGDCELIKAVKPQNEFVQRLILHLLSEFSRADWLIFIVNKSTDG